MYGYKKYMKKDVQNKNSLIQIFAISFFGMLLFFTFIIKSFSPTVDTSIGDYKEQSSSLEEDLETKKIVDGRLQMIQSEDQSRNFSDLMANAEDKVKKEVPVQSDIVIDKQKENPSPIPEAPKPQTQDTIYRVYVGSYTSAEQAKVAKDIISESGSGLNPIVKCIGSNNYTLQVGIFKNKQSAETLLRSIQQNHLPARIVQEY